MTPPGGGGKNPVLGAGWRVLSETLGGGGDGHALVLLAALRSESVFVWSTLDVCRARVGDAGDAWSIDGRVPPTPVYGDLLGGVGPGEGVGCCSQVPGADHCLAGTGGAGESNAVNDPKSPKSSSAGGAAELKSAKSEKSPKSSLAATAGLGRVGVSGPLGRSGAPDMDMARLGDVIDVVLSAELFPGLGLDGRE